MASTEPRVAGLDVGRFVDHSVLVSLHPEDGTDTTTWVVDAIHQLPLGMPFSAQIRELQPHLDQVTHLAVDAGGSGQGLPEQIHGKKLQRLVPVVITGGTGKGTVVKGRVAVGKTALVQGMLQMMFHRELRVSPDAPGRDFLRHEMQAFQYRPDGRFRKMDAKAGEHDDAVMALSLAAFLARRLN